MKITLSKSFSIKLDQLNKFNDDLSDLVRGTSFERDILPLEKKMDKILEKLLTLEAKYSPAYTLYLLKKCFPKDKNITVSESKELGYDCFAVGMSEKELLTKIDMALKEVKAGKKEIIKKIKLNHKALT